MALTPAKLELLNNSDANKLKKNNKDDLCSYIMHLKEKVEELASYQLISKRVELLERSHIQSLQYDRRESLELQGIPEKIKDEDLESCCKDILEGIGCGTIQSSQITACHRLKNKSKTIIRFINRKHANLALHNRKKLRTLNIERHGFPPNTKIYINESLCRPMQFLHYKVRLAAKSKKIDSYNLWKGKLTTKFTADDRASHMNTYQ